MKTPPKIIRAIRLIDQLKTREDFARCIETHPRRDEAMDRLLRDIEAKFTNPQNSVDSR